MAGRGRPENPRAWLITVASRRLTDLLRNEQARQRREDAGRAVGRCPRTGWPHPRTRSSPPRTTRLILLFLCCHPSLSAASQIALTLRAVGGLTTAEIARAFLVPEATMTRRISRAKQSVKDAGARFSLPPDSDERLDAVLKVIYLIFNEGYSSTTGAEPAAGRVGSRGDPAGADGSTAAARRQRGGRVARVDAAHRCASPGAYWAEWRTGSDGRAGSVGVDPRVDRRRRRVDHRGAPPRTGRAVPVAGGDRGGPRRGWICGGDGLAADRRAVRGAVATDGQPDGRVEPRGRGRDGSWRARGVDIARADRGRRADRQGPPAVRSTSAPAGDVGRRGSARGRPTKRPRVEPPACRNSATSTAKPQHSTMLRRPSETAQR